MDSTCPKKNSRFVSRLDSNSIHMALRLLASWKDNLNFWGGSALVTVPNVLFSISIGPLRFCQCYMVSWLSTSLKYNISWYKLLIMKNFSDAYHSPIFTFRRLSRPLRCTNFRPCFSSQIVPPKNLDIWRILLGRMPFFEQGSWWLVSLTYFDESQSVGDTFEEFHQSTCWDGLM